MCACALQVDTAIQRKLIEEQANELSAAKKGVSVGDAA